MGVTGQPQGNGQHFVSSYAPSIEVLKERDIEMVNSKSGRHLVGKGSKPVVSQEGT